MGRVLRCLLLAAAFAAAAPPASAHGPFEAQNGPVATLQGPLATASAYRVRTWPRGVIPYFNAARNYDGRVRDAVRAWNASGVRVRFKRVPRSRARVVIRNVGRGCHGIATLGYAAHLRTHTVALGLRDCQEEGASLVTTHELGHIIGLTHAQRACSVMSTPPQIFCGKPPKPWQRHCRVLQADDLRRARRLYGGRAKPLGPEFCDRWKVPGVPTDGVLHLTGETAVQWRTPTGAVATIRTSAAATCAMARDVSDASTARLDGVRAIPGKVQSLRLGHLDKGPICVVISAHDAYGRSMGDLAVEGTVPNLPPVAGFSVNQVAGGSVNFAADDRDPDGRIVARDWDLGDGTRSTDSYVDHVYARSGTYTVRLVVTDDNGATAVSEQQVTVVVPPPPVAAFTFTDHPGTGRAEASFDGRPSSSQGGTITDFVWDFGDGRGFEYGPTPEYEYSEPGSYEVTLTVYTDDGRRSVTTKQITVTN